VLAVRFTAIGIGAWSCFSWWNSS